MSLWEVNGIPEILAGLLRALSASSAVSPPPLQVCCPQFLVAARARHAPHHRLRPSQPMALPRTEGGPEPAPGIAERDIAPQTGPHTGPLCRIVLSDGVAIT